MLGGGVELAMRVDITFVSTIGAERVLAVVARSAAMPCAMLAVSTDDGVTPNHRCEQRPWDDFVCT